MISSPAIFHNFFWDVLLNLELFLEAAGAGGYAIFGKKSHLLHINWLVKDFGGFLSYLMKLFFVK